MLNNDALAREQALDARKSFIVQAPAGSGKTELLSQRVLKLLSIVNKPEEVVALTFTRKAASEMKTRILDSLKAAQTNIVPEAHKIITNNLAKEVLARDKQLNWNLIENPTRLNITTIDSLCAKIVKQTPILSQIGGDVTIIDEPLPYYEQAIREVFSLVNTDQYDSTCNWTVQFKILLQHFGSNYNKMQGFLLSMLYKREQWLPYLASGDTSGMHKLMLHCWHELGNDLVQNIQELVASDIRAELEDLLSYASDNILAEFSEVSTAQQVILDYSNNKISFWQAASNILFSTSETISFRKRLDKRIGFPSKTAFKDKAAKELAEFKKTRLLEIIADLNNPDLDEFKTDLLLNFELITKLPSFDYSSDNWQLVQIVANILKLLEAELRIIFKNNKITDFSGMSQAALYSLGTEDDPSNISLYFDYSISHILVDEFQDTSFTQYQLLEKLVATWEPDNTKTLFFVGDPMQSIYRFRQAEVGLFLQVVERGLRGIKLDYLVLNKNFRSQQQIVDWVNNKFINLFPRKSNISFGAISYSQSESTKELSNDNKPSLNIFSKSESLNNIYCNENNFIINSIKDIIKTKDGNKSIAILVRNRSKIVDLVLELKKNNINISAVDIELLSERMVIKDLLTLTKSILDLSDKTAWLSTLRAPWCGLTLNDLYLITNGNENQTVWQSINCTETRSLLLEQKESESVNKLNNLILVYDNVFNKLYKVNLYKLIKQAWYALGGNVIYNSQEELSDAGQYFDLLFRLEQSNLILDPDNLDNEVAKLYANHAVSTEHNYTVNIMTIHKSKGLQFDYVFLPYLDSSSRATEHQMLAWQQYHNGSTEGVLLAPFYVKENSQVQFYDTLRFIEKQKENFELVRLFYVAVTRAIKSCVLSASLTHDQIAKYQQENVLAANSSSVLGKISAFISEDEIFVHSTETNYQPLSSGSSIDNLPFRVAAGSSHQNQLRYIDYNSYNLANIISNDNHAYHDYLTQKTRDLLQVQQQTDNPDTYILEDQTLRIIGTFVHKIFYNIAKGFTSVNVLFDNTTKLIKGDYITIWRNVLLRSGVPLSNINKSLELVCQAIKNTLSDKTGLWILNNDYQISMAEQEIYYTPKGKNKTKKSIIDRVFLTEQTIWIVDYKISEHCFADLDEDVQHDYLQQLVHYSYLIKSFYYNLIKDNGYQVKAALYLPLSLEFKIFDSSLLGVNTKLVD